MIFVLVLGVVLLDGGAHLVARADAGRLGRAARPVRAVALPARRLLRQPARELRHAVVRRAPERRAVPEVHARDVACVAEYVPSRPVLEVQRQVPGLAPLSRARARCLGAGAGAAQSARRVLQATSVPLVVGRVTQRHALLLQLLYDVLGVGSVALAEAELEGGAVARVPRY